MASPGHAMFSPLGIDAMLQAEKKIFAAIQYLHNHCDLIKHQIGLDLRDVIAWQKNRLAAEAILSVHLKNDNPTRSDQHLVVMCKRVEAVEFYRCHFDKFCSAISDGFYGLIAALSNHKSKTEQELRSARLDAVHIERIVVIRTKQMEATVMHLNELQHNRRVMEQTIEARKSSHPYPSGIAPDGTQDGTRYIAKRRLWVTTLYGMASRLARALPADLEDAARFLEAVDDTKAWRLCKS